jgi:hypothetical protein
MNVLSRVMFACAGVCLSATPAAAAEKPPTSEASMLVQGSILIGPDGKVISYQVDRPERLPAAVVEVVQKNVPGWTFVLDDHPSVPIKETMSLRVVARALDDTHAKLVITGASFSDGSPDKTYAVHGKSTPSPRYPRMSFDARVSGTVYLVLQIGPDGRVQQAFAEQVNLRRYQTQTRNEVFEHDLANAAIDGVQRWTFVVPTSGPEANASSWTVRIPLSFELRGVGDGGPDTYGTWDAYMPGTVHKAPWLNDNQLVSGKPDSLSDGMLQQLGKGPRLATSLDSN